MRQRATAFKTIVDGTLLFLREFHFSKGGGGGGE